MRFVDTYKLLVFAFLFLLTGSSCRQSPEQYVKAVESPEGDHFRELSIADWEYQVQHRPHRYIAQKEGLKPGSAGFEERIKALEGFVFFNVKVRHKTEQQESALRLMSGSLPEYQANLDYLMNRNQQNFELSVNDGQGEYPVIYHYENNYNLGPVDVIVLGFRMETGKAKQKITLQYNDRFLGNGIVRFPFKF